ncbi:uncharacterized protein LOC113495235 [Trichoplusia ni]|uniref:Uncharacterized protein LOC113495235 n=1 Tax=Trichoplusia ni TaxID=7111 RepID=A0A7E5VMW6_TRINI|nr:uncharacterized protein LOC113495235 [Trichoplusia ni]
MSFLYVKCYYGPCNTFHNNGHKPQCLNGLRDGLQHLGFRIDLLPVDFENYCMLEMCGHEIFRCNIKQFHFNTTGHRDLVCTRAIDAVLQSAVKFRRARAYLWFWTLTEHEMFIRRKNFPVDHWITKIKYEKSVPCKTCKQCCNIKEHQRQAIED